MGIISDVVVDFRLLFLFVAVVEKGARIEEKLMRNTKEEQKHERTKDKSERKENAMIRKQIFIKQKKGSACRRVFEKLVFRERNLDIE
jgi:hypothetical protein